MSLVWGRGPSSGMLVSNVNCDLEELFAGAPTLCMALSDAGCARVVGICSALMGRADSCHTGQRAQRRQEDDDSRGCSTGRHCLGARCGSGSRRTPMRCEPCELLYLPPPRHSECVTPVQCSQQQRSVTFGHQAHIMHALCGVCRLPVHCSVLAWAHSLTAVDWAL